MRPKINPTPVTTSTKYKLDDGQPSISNYFPARNLTKPITIDNSWQNRVIDSQNHEHLSLANHSSVNNYHSDYQQQIAHFQKNNEQKRILAEEKSNNLTKNKMLDLENRPAMQSIENLLLHRTGTTPCDSPRNSEFLSKVNSIKTGDGDSTNRSRLSDKSRLSKANTLGNLSQFGGLSNRSKFDKKRNQILNLKFIQNITSVENPKNVSSIDISGYSFSDIKKSELKDEDFETCTYIQASRTNNTINLDTFDDISALSDLELNMSQIAYLSVPDIKPNWNLSVLDLSFNNLNIRIAENMTILSHIPKLRVLNLSGNDLGNLGNLVAGSAVFENLDLFVAENNCLKTEVFLEVKEMFPNLKVLLLNDNKIRQIPYFTSESIDDDAQENESQIDQSEPIIPNPDLKIISLISNPITNLEDFCHATQYPNLSVLKLQNTPFVKTTSKNPDFITNSHITVERHFEDKKKENSKNHYNLAKKVNHIKKRRIEPVIRFKKDKRWFEDLIGELENRVKYEVKKAVLGDLDSLESGSTAKVEENDDDDDNKSKDAVENAEKLQGNPIFMTQFEFEQKSGQTQNAKQPETLDQTDNESFLSETMTNLSIINESDYSDSRSYLRTPPMPIPDTVSRLRMELNKKNNISQIHQSSSKNFNNFNDNTINVKKFLYEGPMSKPNTEKAQLVKNFIEHDQKSEDVVHRMLDKLKNETAIDKSSLGKNDLDKFKKLEQEYLRLREQVGKMDQQIKVKDDEGQQ